MVKTRKEVRVCGAACVYLLHFPDRSHYTGSTTVGPVERLARHLAGRGSRWVYKHIQRVGNPRIGAVVWYPTVAGCRANEERFKRNRKKLLRRCCICDGTQDRPSLG